ncbi:hypothetical protein RHECIAT_PA0000109 (plasmid) [Rhizobium etli CIAT 652]|uniref:Tail specific protease N-terminal domain-containing protein n=1 Tax=Rhizobium etli (strain CIAT 652) TaxID=491916 RepID=B3Q199_RHIE6|nr:hypothetical protein RHECIAT_PA0000109 [Rhizobium etli CIAT 652]
MKPLERQVDAALLSAQFLSRYRYKPVALDDALSARVVDGFIKSLDPDRMLFLQADIPFAIFNAYEQRVADRMSYAQPAEAGSRFQRQET